MKLSVIVEADYDDLHDQKALTREAMEGNLKIIAKRIEDDYKNRVSEQNKYGVFYQMYKMDAGAAPGRLRADNTVQEILKQAELPLQENPSGDTAND